MSDKKVVLHVGCGPENAAGLHAAFRGVGWREIRLDIDPEVKPEIIGSLTDMGMVQSESMDAVWSSHNVEHLFSHQVPVALREFYRALKPGGFALVTLPDLQAAAEMVAADQLDEVAYVSPAGPIAPMDMIYSYRRFLLDENEFMCHRTGFTARTLYRALRSAGFSVVVVERHDFCLWATAWKDPVAMPLSMSGLGVQPYVPQNDDEMLAGCRLWHRGNEENRVGYRTLHELRITAGQERIAPVVLIEHPEEIAFIPHFNDLLDRCQFLTHLVVIAPFAAPPGWYDNERQEWLRLPDGLPGFIAKVVHGVPADWAGLLKPAPLAYGQPQGVVALTSAEADTWPEISPAPVPAVAPENLEPSVSAPETASDVPQPERCRNLRKWLLAGDYEQGLAALDACASASMDAGLPRWDGLIRPNDTLLLQAGGDWGEAIQMVRYARFIAEKGMRVVLQCPRELEEILQTHDGVALTYNNHEVARSGSHILPISSLPYLFQTRLDSIPQNIPYLFSRSEDVMAWRERLARYDHTIKIGLYWNDRTLADDLLEALDGLSGVTFFDLAGGDGMGIAAPIPELAGAPALYSPVLDVLDMVIAEESWVLHLAGALGRTAWGLLPEGHGWCWGTGDRSPWYPRTLLLRQSGNGEWREVVGTVRLLLEAVMEDVLTAQAERSATGICE